MYLGLLSIYIYIIFIIIVEKIINKRVLFVLLSISIFLVFFATFRDGTQVNDYENYVAFFESDLDLSDSLIEPSFVILSNLIKLFLNDGILFLFFTYALLGVVSKIIAIKNISEFWFISILIYLSYFYLVQEMTQIRAGVAAGFFMLSIKPLYDKKYLVFILYSLIAFFFHNSALICFGLIFLNSTSFNKKIYILLIPIAYLMYFLHIDFYMLAKFIPIDSVQQKLEIYLTTMDSNFIDKSDINVFSAIQILRIGFFYFFVYYLDILIDKNRYTYLLMKIYCIALLSLVLLAKVPSVAFRIADFLLVVEILLLPSMLYLFQSRKIAILIIFIFCFIQLYISLFNLKLIF